MFLGYSGACAGIAQKHKSGKPGPAVPRTETPQKEKSRSWVQPKAKNPATGTPDDGTTGCLNAVFYLS
jgi:hypothetical protein